VNNNEEEEEEEEEEEKNYAFTRSRACICHTFGQLSYWVTFVKHLPYQFEGVPTTRIHHHPTHHKQVSCLLFKHKKVVGKQQQVSTS
jgi:hypothetical protein